MSPFWAPGFFLCHCSKLCSPTGAMHPPLGPRVQAHSGGARVAWPVLAGGLRGLETRPVRRPELGRAQVPIGQICKTSPSGQDKGHESLGDVTSDVFREAPLGRCSRRCESGDSGGTSRSTRGPCQRDCPEIRETQGPGGGDALPRLLQAELLVPDEKGTLQPNA